ncbi:hypothetical protein [Halopelagius longus]|uniref:Uncharacterized protein n=1 Tax=Halopelagius longus TaxID=1236180 RepID=A0A1H1DPV8_9EURY|nr:hypothetical protein [Halopelagius longus]RDI71424.1 hypothetical protein DWB78_06635 [Halopelagius longus]SDQ78571.1 hypothetical protein SAMN05216278_2524 [Halopelagius longus]
MGSVGSTDTGDTSGTKRREQTGSLSRFVEWVKIDGDRLVVTFGIAAIIFAFVLALYFLDVIAFENQNSITRMASGMIAGSFSLVTLVVSVNQLILSQEFSPAGKHRDQYAGVMDFRRDIEERSSVSTAPIEPARIVAVIADAIVRRGDELADAVEGHRDEEFEREVLRYTDRLRSDTEWINEQIDRSSVEAFDALSVAVEYDDGWQISAARSLRNDAPALTDETSAAFEDLIGTLRLFSTTQEHFKTVYLQRELTRFSQLTIYCGIPAVLAAALIALLYGDAGGAAINVQLLPYVTSFLATVVFVPLALLASYILRTATVTRRTATTGPMLLEEPTKERPGDVRESEAD